MRKVLEENKLLACELSVSPTESQTATGHENDGTKKRICSCNNQNCRKRMSYLETVVEFGSAMHSETVPDWCSFYEARAAVPQQGRDLNAKSIAKAGIDR